MRLWKRAGGTDIFSLTKFTVKLTAKQVQPYHTVSCAYGGSYNHKNVVKTAPVVLPKINYTEISTCNVTNLQYSIIPHRSDNRFICKATPLTHYVDCPQVKLKMNILSNGGKRLDSRLCNGDDNDRGVFCGYDGFSNLMVVEAS